MEKKTVIPEILKKDEAALLNDWMRAQLAASNRRSDLISDEALRAESAELLRKLREAVPGGITDIGSDHWRETREVLANTSRARAVQGFSPSETATFVLSLKQPLFARLAAALAQQPEKLADELWAASALIDQLALFTVESFITSREELIARQQAEMLELSTPVVKLWDGILALPMIGTLDSARTQVVMEQLLQRIVETGSQIAILDITGVPTVDTLVAQHLIKTVAAARLMGADCIISGIRPQIAQTMVHLSIDLTNIITKASLADAFLIALQKIGAAPVAKVGNAAERQGKQAQKTH